MSLGMVLALCDPWRYTVGGADTKDDRMSLCPEKEYFRKNFRMKNSKHTQK